MYTSLIFGTLKIEYGETISARTPLSSQTSRSAACSVVSPASMNPAGKVQVPGRGGMARWHSRYLPSRSMMQPAMIFGLM
ncbi:hypothetical protein D3C77_634780 [compost metagenome]